MMSSRIRGMTVVAAIVFVAALGLHVPAGVAQHAPCNPAVSECP
jgi:hypothetical protein